MGLAQTGTGKTAAFTLPIIDRLIDGPRRTRALILTPTRELCVQVEESFRKYAKHAPISVVAVYGGVPLEPQEKKLRAGVDVVVATPGRLIDHLERQNVVFDDLEVLVLDEADRMLDMGFAPQINRIVGADPAYRQTLLFSATMPPEVEALARKYLRKPVVVQVGVRSAAASTVTHAVYPGAAREEERAARASCCTSKAARLGADLLAHQARRRPRRARPGEGGAEGRRRCTPTRRRRSARSALAGLQGWQDRACSSRRTSRSAGSTSRGITHVINYDVPQQAEDYVHRIGRTGPRGEGRRRLHLHVAGRDRRWCARSSG